jgi:alkylation response protein AidB-like acyl-CoA dehydrogenase
MNGRNQEVQSVDFRLTDEQAMTRDMVREFAQEEVKPAAFLLDAKKDPKDCIPWDLIKKASQMGLRTTAIPEKWGGEGADYPTLAIILEELGAADHGFATILRGCYTESPRLIAELSDEQRDEFLPKFLKDDTFLLGLARTEPDAGTDSHYLYDEPGAPLPKKGATSTSSTGRSTSFRAAASPSCIFSMQGPTRKARSPRA